MIKPKKNALIVLAVFISSALLGVRSQLDTKLVPAIITFGDSSVDVGNNDYVKTVFRADFPPYGRDFKNHQPTGRFCNGKLATDITAENLGFTSYPPAYLSPQASGKNLLIGANFASAGSGYWDKTAVALDVIPLSQQFVYYKEYQSKLAAVAGSAKAKSILKEAIYLVGSGSSDFIQNYYINPFLYKVYSPDEYSSFLIGFFTSFIKDMYSLGARRFGVTSLPPLGCVPAAITLFGEGSNSCVSRLNIDAQGFNKKLNATANQLSKELSGIKLIIFDIYTPFLDLVNHPSNYGFFESRKGCCGTGIVETAVLCNPHSPGTCKNASAYVFWDSVHPTEAANQLLASTLLVQGINLIT
ncbi:GDSL esterase/lipase APG [Acorus gramineus]|uniref:GDSL esterase/lipase APG n=1 Tax=Acorus gramineus TaxID=55184 RepID=A0AAV9AJR7_ACOGR|nr:GDSL esterase/lipase APG [Acorus gramineus]